MQAIIVVTSWQPEADSKARGSTVSTTEFSEWIF